MKKVICLSISLMLCFFSFFIFSACDNESKDNSTTTASLTETKTSAKTDVQSDNNKTTSFENDIGGGFITTRKYRVRYYSVPYQFILLVGEDAYNEWRALNNTKTTDELNEMKIKRFIQYFNISREDFDKANLEFAKVLKGEFDIKLMMNPKDYADQEIEEIFNADIIYTFDDEIINNYYLSPDYLFSMQIEYQNAVADGTYQTRTTDWVDIEQMEADIIAKYGEAEIVTEAVNTEPSANIPDETETTA